MRAFTKYQATDGTEFEKIDELVNYEVAREMEKKLDETGSEAWTLAQAFPVLIKHYNTIRTRVAKEADRMERS